MATFPGGNPTALGKVTVDAAGTPEKLTKNFPDLDPATPSPEAVHARHCKSIFVQALNSNSDLIIVGKRGMVTATGVNVLAELSAGQSYSLWMNDAPNAFDIGDFELDAIVSTEGAQVSMTHQ